MIDSIILYAFNEDLFGEKIQELMSLVCGAGIMFIFVFIWQFLFIAPLKIWSEQNKQIQEMNNILSKKKNTAQISKLRASL
ncbi:MAG: hypothetical protein KAS59_05565 [Alphaproteobacteria bacterium]|nr:hypothetical protein [Alphaproteobacteria bacterium]